MILRIEDLQIICNKLLGVLDVDSVSKLSDALEIMSDGSTLYVSISNGDYKVVISQNVSVSEKFHATVESSKFLPLVKKTTSETVEIKTEDNFLIFIGNGNYKLPLVFSDDKLLTLPDINVDNVVHSFELESDSMKSILKYNSKEVSKTNFAQQVQTMYYIDKEGCITFTNSACVNNFNVGADIKLLLSKNIVNTFSLFDEGKVSWEYGVDTVGNQTQTKIHLYNDNINVYSIILRDDSLSNSVPKDIIRSIATEDYPYTVVFNVNDFIGALERIKIFGDKLIDTYVKFKGEGNFLTLQSTSEDVKEKININNMTIDNDYEMILDINDLKSIIDYAVAGFITMKFGNHKSVVIQKDSIYNIIPECII